MSKPGLRSHVWLIKLHWNSTRIKHWNNIEGVPFKITQLASTGITEKKTENIFVVEFLYFMNYQTLMEIFSPNSSSEPLLWIAWYLYLSILKFHLCFSDPTILAECDLDEKTKEVLLSNIKRKLTSQAVKIRADIECACYGYEGIDAVKTALKTGLSLSTEELPIKINLIAPPLYGKYKWEI